MGPRAFARGYVPRSLQDQATITERNMATEKRTAPRAFCFVLMPFEDSFGDVYELGIKEACTQAGAYCERQPITDTTTDH